MEPDLGPGSYYSNAAVAILKRLAKHGGCMRIGSLLRECTLSCDELCAALNDLAERQCIRVALRRTSHATLPPRLRKVGRVTLTRFGRSRVPVPWIWPELRRSPRRLGHR
jgi:hypothetical protein